MSKPPAPPVAGSRRPGVQAFGLRLVTDIALPGQWHLATAATDRVLEIALDPSIPHMLHGTSVEWTAMIDGAVLTVERDGHGAFLFRHDTGRHLLSPDGHTLRCAPVTERGSAWLRVLLDPVLMCVALFGGLEGLHAASVVVGQEAVAITARSGGGKSTLLAELMRRGHFLMADDITMLEPNGGDRPLALPSPPVMTLADAWEHPTHGEVLMDLRGERWVTANVTERPAPLRAIVYLERLPGAMTAIQASPDTLRVVLGALLALPKTPERALSRFALASTLATRSDILTLTADSLTAPAELAELIEQVIVAA